MGGLAATRPAADIDRAQLVRMMVGRPVESLFAQRIAARVGAPLLRVENLCLAGTFADVSFVVRAGETVGMASGPRRCWPIGDCPGAVRHDLADGRLAAPLKDKAVVPRSPGQMLGLGLAYLPEDRDGQGLIMPESDRGERDPLPIIGKLARLGVLARASQRRVASEAVATYRVKANDIAQAVSTLSRVAIAKRSPLPNG